MPKPKIKSLDASQITELIETLRNRFQENMSRHQGQKWAKVEARLVASDAALWSLSEMERSGGEPDVISFGKRSEELVFVDCSPESPKGRRSLCYDRDAWESRKEHKPAGSAIEQASAMGVEILSEAEYRGLQELGEFDLKTSSWILTPSSIRRLGGALFCDRRYDAVFTYHNGAESYYAARGFRAKLIV